MPLTTMKEILLDAQRKGYAVGAFEVWNLESIQVIVRAAEAMGSPVIFAIGPLEIDYAGMEDLASLALSHARAAKVAIAVHLDHGDSFDLAREAIEHEFTSVMIDASGETYEENVEVTRRVVALARPRGVTVEGELGVLGTLEGGEDGPAAVCTEASDAKRYVEETGVDALAVAIGNAHGYYKGEPRLDLDRLRAIRAEVDAPLVLHGGTGIPEGTLREAIAAGITKVNIATEFFDAFAKAYAEAYAKIEGKVTVPICFGSGLGAGEGLVRKKIQIFGGNHQGGSIQ